MNINEAICIVLTSKYKKDAPKAFKIVENTPELMVYKANGRFCVQNKENYKNINYVEGNYGKKDIIVYGRRSVELGKMKKIDWYNFLITKRDQTWRFVNGESCAIKKYKELKDKENHLRWDNDNLGAAKGRLKAAQRDVEIYISKVAQRENDLRNFRKEIGLKEK